MHHHYTCIRSRIPEEPQWFDEDGVPRYEPFTPHQLANIYAREAALLHIECQNCGRPFKVAMATDSMAEAMKKPVLSELVTTKQIHYGDPPNVECCPSGPTMNSVPRRVLEFWRFTWPAAEWVRAPELEVDVWPDWMNDEPATQHQRPDSEDQ